jgi:hypothetical protein
MHIMVFLETMHYKDYSEQKGPTFEGYTLLDQQTATKENANRGRGSGGMLTFLRDDAATPLQVLKKYHTTPECIPIVITGKIKGSDKKGTLLLAHNIKPEDTKETYDQIIKDMTKIIRKLRKDYYMILAGDGNAKLGDIVGDTKKPEKRSRETIPKDDGRNRDNEPTTNRTRTTLDTLQRGKREAQKQENLRPRRSNIHHRLSQRTRRHDKRQHNQRHNLTE